MRGIGGAHGIGGGRGAGEGSVPEDAAPGPASSPGLPGIRNGRPPVPGGGGAKKPACGTRRASAASSSSHFGTLSGSGSQSSARGSSVEVYSTEDCVIRMYASSSEARCGDSSHSRTPAACARSEIRGSSSPVTRSAPSGSRRTRPPARVRTEPRVSQPPGSVSAVRTRANPAELWVMKSWVLMSASSRPRPITIRWSAVSAISLMRCEETKTVRPSEASRRIRLRTQRMPSGSRPLTGSSKSSTWGSPSRAVAMPRRWPMPSEKPLARCRATSCRPTTPSTSSTRFSGIPESWAIDSRWVRARRPPWTALASSRAPTCRWAFGSSRKGRPLIVTRPAVGRSRPTIMRIVVDFPEPLGPRNPVT